MGPAVVPSVLTRQVKRLSPARQKLVGGILDDLSETAFLPARQVAARFDIDPATVVRTTQALGYRRYSDFARDLRVCLIERLAASAPEGTSEHPTSPAWRSIDRHIHNLRLIRDHLNPVLLATLGRRLRSCRHLIVVSNETNHGLAELVALTLRAAGIDASVPSSQRLTLVRTTTQEGVIAVALGDCCQFIETFVQQARNRGAFTMALTSSASSPLTLLAEHSLFVPSTNRAFDDSGAAALVIFNALVAEIVGVK